MTPRSTPPPRVASLRSRPVFTLLWYSHHRNRNYLNTQSNPHIHTHTHTHTHTRTHKTTTTTTTTMANRPLSIKKKLCQKYLHGECDLSVGQCEGAHPVNLDPSRAPLAPHPFTTDKGVACNRCLMRLLVVCMHICSDENVTDCRSATNQAVARHPTTPAPSAATSEVPTSRSAPAAST